MLQVLDFLSLKQVSELRNSLGGWVSWRPDGFSHKFPSLKLVNLGPGTGPTREALPVKIAALLAHLLGFEHRTPAPKYTTKGAGR